MSEDPRSSQLEHIHVLIDAHRFDEARHALTEAGVSDARFALAQIKLGLADGTLAPDHAIERLAQLLRKDPRLEGARELYQRASGQAYVKGHSSMAHSHPPPSPKPPK
jgi:hypothetical protein